MGISCTMSPPGSARDGSSIAKTWLRGLAKRRGPSSASCVGRISANSWCALRTRLHNSLVKTTSNAIISDKSLYRRQIFAPISIVPLNRLSTPHKSLIFHLSWVNSMRISHTQAALLPD